MLFVIISIFVIVFGGMAFGVYYQLKKTDPKKMDTSTIKNISTAQEFLPFEDIKDGMIILGGHKYRAIIEASSTNYNLKTDQEKEILEISFQRFVNSLSFPITFYIQTKVMDNTTLLQMLEEEIKVAKEQFPMLEEYANQYFAEMADLHSYIGNNKQKKKYIIVPFEDGINLPNLTDEEKYDYSLKELYTRATIIMDGLSSIGVKAKLLNTTELAELVYATYHKENYSQVANIANGDFLSLVTESEKRTMENISDDARLDWILYEAQMRLKTELMSENTPDFIVQNVEKAIKSLDQLRNETSGYYRQVDRADELPLTDGDIEFLDQTEGQPTQHEGSAHVDDDDLV